ncbi:ubiquitin fusion degradation protein 1 [Nannizzia gypsea CBS 118893]|uniref:Ubiquitin fusion degradation protein 1 n=1 Tax=Arthroderma gypseum (strain ATCC MYA-4604 / CBS 118893) TaxID=535722 RepID=E4V2Z3_ARTGP|nr:ubiquitin fusion degradation protein 1 [Nannizzia gypsea CBS 118893]EFR04367.1 ubiquitin fusion degradation protein 1 [Nannizzia gypsea CBS 118893]
MEGLSWTSKLAVTPPSKTLKLTGDKITLPQTALEQILAAVRSIPSSTQGNPLSVDFNSHSFLDNSDARQRDLPHPLTFRLVNPINGRVVHSGIREFSADENEVSLSPFLRESLGIEDSSFDIEPDSTQTETQPTITVHVAQLPKGSYVRLRPLEAGYDVEDWKALLERQLRDNYTTLSVGEVLTVTASRSETMQFLVDKVQPDGKAICIVDTDLEVDIEPMDEDQARESLEKRLARHTRAPENGEQSSIGGKIVDGQVINGQVLLGEYVDYELETWVWSKPFTFKMNFDDEMAVDIYASPYSARQRARPRSDQHLWGNFSNNSPKIIEIKPTNVELHDADCLYVSIHAPLPQPGSQDGSTEPSHAKPITFQLCVTTSNESENTAEEDGLDQNAHGSDEMRCTNCYQWIPKATMVLHENFCFRNNVVCPKCKKVFQKRSPNWESHWHCPQDDANGSGTSSKDRHDAVFHSTYTCQDCQYVCRNLPDLAQHRTTVCPEKLILCQFCHLVVPQKGESDPDVLDPEVVLSNLTPHELVDGGRTTECHLCHKIVRLRDMNTHLRHHELDRVSRPSPQICLNLNCSRTINGPNYKQRDLTNDTLGLCKVCFGPLYVDVYDPEGKALRRRIERKYLSQMLTGCGKPWCRNKYCKTGRTGLNVDPGASLASKEIITMIKPLVEEVSIGPTVVNTSPLYFCTDEATQRRRELAEVLAVEVVADMDSHTESYEIEWCIAAMESTSGDPFKAREWLHNWAPKKGETYTGSS